MKTIILIAAIFLTANMVYAGGGWASCAVNVAKNGTNYQYLLNDEGWSDGIWETNSLFDSFNFGTPTTLVLNGGESNAWTDDYPGYTAASFVLYYRVYLSSGSAGSWNSVALNNLEYQTGNNYIWSKSNANIDILALASTTGVYTLEVAMSKIQFFTGGYWNSMIPGGQATAYSAVTPGFKATFTFSGMPVELNAFTAQPKGNKIVLNWSTATEKDNFGFDVERKDKTAEAWTKIGFIEGHGTTNTPQSYSFTDNSSTGKIQYRLKQIDHSGNSEYSKIVETEMAAAKNFSLMQNYPNPFNPSTSIVYSLPQAANVKLFVYNSLGQTVKVLENGFKEAGNYTVSFNASELPSGLYFYKIEAGEFSQIKKMILLK